MAIVTIFSLNQNESSPQLSVQTKDLNLFSFIHLKSKVKIDASNEIK